MNDLTTGDIDRSITLDNTCQRVVSISLIIIISIVHIRTATTTVDITTIGIVVVFTLECYFIRMIFVIFISNVVICTMDTDSATIDANKRTVEVMSVLTTTID